MCIKMRLRQGRWEYWSILSDIFKYVQCDEESKTVHDLEVYHIGL